MITENKLFKKIDINDIRIASYNVLSDNTAESRYGMLNEQLKELEADIITCQEYTPNFYPEINPNLEAMGYVLVIPDDILEHLPRTDHNVTPIFYRADKLELVTSGYKRYESVKITREFTKSCTWALLKDKSSGKQFIVTSTHMTSVPSAGGLSGDELRNQDAEELVAKAETLAATFGRDIPIILTGDFNFSSHAKAYDTITKKFNDAKTLAKVKNNTEYGSCRPSTSTMPAVNGYTCDHFFTSEKNIDVKQMQYVIDPLLIEASDHLPIVLDISLD